MAENMFWIVWVFFAFPRYKTTKRFGVDGGEAAVAGTIWLIKFLLYHLASTLIGVQSH